MSFFKNKPLRDKEYTDWVKSLPSAISGLPADDPHHLIGHGTGGTKTSDLFTFPLTRDEHTELHNMGYQSWEEIHGSQWEYVAKTIEMAVKDGIITNFID
jgi:hypothetical protein